jgi:hypothetical protein
LIILIIFGEEYKLWSSCVSVTTWQQREDLMTRLQSFPNCFFSILFCLNLKPSLLEITINIYSSTKQISLYILIIYIYVWDYNT